MFAEVAIPKTLLDTLTYSIPDNLSALINPGSLIKVELRKKKTYGIVIEVNKTSPVKNTKGILELIEPEFISADLLSLLVWTKKYYFTNWGQVLNLSIPQSVYPAPIFKKTTSQTQSNVDTIVTNKNRCGTANIIINRFDEKSSKPILLNSLDNHEIYLDIIQYTIANKKSAIILVPEIILTPKFIARFQESLGDSLYLLHSGLKLTERKRIWHELRSRDYSVVLGTRSTIFAPVKNLGLIIVDNESDSSYKEQERHFHYNARDIAVKRGQISKALTVLTSSFPSCESFYNAKTDKYELISIPSTEPKTKDRVLLFDMRHSKDKILSPKLKFEIQDANHKNKQIVLFLNRRAYAKVMTCADCGHIPLCPNCAIPLVLHSQNNTLVCNMCKHKQPSFDFCPQCKGSEFTFSGIGTQKLLSEVKQIVPDPDILRLDSDVKLPMSDTAHGIRSTVHGNQILITTRLGIRDLDYSKLGLFGVISADTSLYVPDFRAQEKTFQELSKIIQESSINKDCKVIIQTYHPDNYAIYRSVQENYLKFFEQEIDSRNKLSYPPFTRLASINISAPNLENTRKVATKIEKYLSKIKNITVLGPSLIPHPRKPRVQTYQFLIKIKSNQSLANLVPRKDLLSPTFMDNGQCDVDINIDPL